MEYDNILNASGHLPIRTTLIKYYVPIIKFRNGPKVRIFSIN
jgi:hypothetical protein